MVKKYTSAVRIKNIYYVANPYLVQNKRNNTYVIMYNNNATSRENNRNTSYEDIVNTGLSNPIVDLGIDYSEIGLDSFINNETVKELPVIKTIASLIKVGLSIKEWHFARKFLKFLERFHSGSLSENEKNTFLEKYYEDSSYREKVVTLLITANDKYFETKQSEICGCLFVAHVKGLISWEEYTILCGCIDRFSSFAEGLLDELENEKEPYHRGYQGAGDARAAALIACAFACQWGTHIYVTPFGILAHQYGIKGDYTYTPEELYSKAGYQKK